MRWRVTGREEYLLNKRFMQAMEVLMPELLFAVGGTVQCSEFLLSFRLRVWTIKTANNTKASVCLYPAVHRRRALQHHK